jgi:uncharacterized protein
MQISTIEELEKIYHVKPALASTTKVTATLTKEYRQLIEASSFVALATAGPEGLDCSPRGDRSSVATIIDDSTLALPDRRGNNRIDSLLNIVRDSRVALMFMIPGAGTIVRINGTATISIAPELLERFRVEGNPPRSVILVTIAECYFQCARAVVRSDIWNPERAPVVLPTPGDILNHLSKGEIEGKAYDEEWPGRAAKSLW